MPTRFGIEYVISLEDCWRDHSGYYTTIASLLRQLAPYQGKILTPEDIAQLAKNSHLWHVVDLEDGHRGHVYGMARLVPRRDRTAELHDLIVVPPKGTRGMGEALLTTVIDTAQKLQLSSLMATIKTKRGEAQRLAKKLGFELIEPGDPNNLESPNLYRLTLPSSPGPRTQKHRPAARS